MTTRVSIGDFAVMTGLSRKALRQYHDIGILEPAHVDPYTGYRWYATAQVDHAHLIRRFRSLDMSIRDIEALLSTDDPATRTEIITGHLTRMEEQLEQTRAAVTALRELLSPVTPAASVSVRHDPALTVWAVTDTIDLADIDTWFAAALTTLLAAVGPGPSAIVPGGLYDRDLFLESHGAATLFVPAPEQVDPPADVRAAVLPDADHAVLTHLGGHDRIDRSYAALGVHVNEHLVSHAGPIREHYLGGTPAEPTAFTATEICWPIVLT
ncbi:MerR family transcriptional regulator [Rhodococcoides corynebacterioides]|uniref:MerR family transcriptional regulator n=1 Tax=Rhodococcoides corynebacterioides TaxID=53972 RepID=UPI003F814522